MRPHADEAGEIVLPPLYYAIADDDSEAISIGAACDGGMLRPLHVETFPQLFEAGYEVIVALTGHYPDAQTAMVEEVAESVESNYDATLIALPEHEAYMPEVDGDTLGNGRRVSCSTSIRNS